MMCPRGCPGEKLARPPTCPRCSNAMHFVDGLRSTRLLACTNEGQCNGARDLAGRSTPARGIPGGKHAEPETTTGTHDIATQTEELVPNSDVLGVLMI